MKEKLFVISIDAMVREDVEYMLTKPNFAKIMGKRAEVEQVCSVYPALTYPAHATLATGCNPGKHGILHNQPPIPFADKVSHWYLYSRDMKVENIFAAAKRAGCTTASVYWPTTGCDTNIDHNIDEYFFYYPDETIEQGFARLGADEAALKAVRENLHRYPTTIRSGKIDLASTFDNFAIGCTCSLIRNNQPDVMLVHVCPVDSARHRYGTFANEVYDAMDQMDLWLGEIVDAMEAAGVYEDTNFVILSDHGQRDIKRFINLNVLLEQGGFIDLGWDGSVYNWKAYAKTNGMSAGIYLQDYTDEKIYRKVYDYLKALAADPDNGIEAIHTADDVRERYGVYGTVAFVVEADDDTAFGVACKGPVTKWIKDEENPSYRAKHGYQPEKGPQPIFMGHGPAFKDGAVLSNARLMDVAPTLAAVLGQEMPQAEGRPLKELLTLTNYFYSGK